MSYAQPDDVAELLGRDLTAEEAVIVQRRLEHVEDMIISRIPDIADRVAADARLGRFVQAIETDAVLRLIRNLAGVSGEADGTYSYKIDKNVASGRLLILPDEWALLLSGTSTVGVLSFDLGRVLPGRTEGGFDPRRGPSGPNTAPFEQGLWENNEGAWS